MTTQAILKNLLRFRKSERQRKAYLRDFEKRMAYRTTKTEHPETTRGMVNRVLNQS